MFNFNFFKTKNLYPTQEVVKHEMFLKKKGVSAPKLKLDLGSWYQWNKQTNKTKTNKQTNKQNKNKQTNKQTRPGFSCRLTT
jgi:hypothetical protein